jgi:hypothetical protein
LPTAVTESPMVTVVRFFMLLNVPSNTTLLLITAFAMLSHLENTLLLNSVSELPIATEVRAEQP